MRTITENIFQGSRKGGGEKAIFYKLYQTQYCFIQYMTQQKKNHTLKDKTPLAQFQNFSSRLDALYIFFDFHPYIFQDWGIFFSKSLDDTLYHLHQLSNSIQIGR